MTGFNELMATLLIAGMVPGVTALGGIYSLLARDWWFAAFMFAASILTIRYGAVEAVLSSSTETVLVTGAGWFLASVFVILFFEPAKQAATRESGSGDAEETGEDYEDINVPQL
ncbi:hypothetical protein ACM16X_02320 [Haloarcula japonica]|uniref:hypothetical protein n=1 Tax=Haloarcula japonica TaxID=29282 RepID=UPI0039F73B28